MITEKFSKWYFGFRCNLLNDAPKNPRDEDILWKIEKRAELKTKYGIDISNDGPITFVAKLLFASAVTSQQFTAKQIAWLETFGVFTKVARIGETLMMFALDGSYTRVFFGDWFADHLVNIEAGIDQTIEEITQWHLRPENIPPTILLRPWKKTPLTGWVREKMFGKSNPQSTKQSAKESTKQE